MKNLKFIVLILTTAVFAVSCNYINSGGSSITGQQVENYIKAYKNLRDVAPDMLDNVNKNASIETGQEGFANFEKAIKDAGLKDFKEFVVLNAKIGAIFSILQGSEYSDNFANQVEQGTSQMGDAIKEYEKKIADPNVPEDLKKEYKKAMEEMKQGQEYIQKTFDENKKWADLVMDKTKKITNLIISKGDVEVVKKYENQIMEAYSGFSKPENFNTQQ